MMLFLSWEFSKRVAWKFLRLILKSQFFILASFFNTSSYLPSKTSSSSRICMLTFYSSAISSSSGSITSPINYSWLSALMSDIFSEGSLSSLISSSSYSSNESLSSSWWVSDGNGSSLDERSVMGTGSLLGSTLLGS